MLETSSREEIRSAVKFMNLFFKDIYCTDSIYSVYKDKLQNCSCNQFEIVFTLWYKWN